MAPDLSPMPEGADLADAFGRLGRALAARGTFVELAVHEGGATAFRLAWNLEGDLAVEILDLEEALVPAAAAAAEGTPLDPGWLVGAVGRGPSDGTLFGLAGTYPEGPAPGLRLLVADARYLRLMDALANSGGRA